MRTRLARFPAVGAAVGLAVALTSAVAGAQPTGEGSENKEATEKAPDQEPKKAKEATAGAKEGSAATTESGDKWDPKEVDGKAYRFLGIRFRDYIVPKFMFGIFANGGATVNVFTFGPELTIRKDGIEFEVTLTPFADYSMKPFLFKGKSDNTQAYELVSSSLHLVTLSLDIMKDIPIDNAGKFSFLIGGGVGLSAVFGNLYRSQVYPKGGPAEWNNPNTEDPDAWELCPGPQATPYYQNPTHPYCDASNSHFGDPRNHSGYNEPSWANGGSKPFIFPYIVLPQLSFRYKPIKQLQTRLDVGFSITGFFFGLSAGYGL